MIKRLPATTLLILGLLLCGVSLESEAQQGGLGVFRTRTSVTKLKDASPKPKDAPVEVLGSKPEDRKHEDVCIINAKGGQTIFNARNANDLLEKIKKDARKCGADAIIIAGSEDRAWKPFQGGVTQAKSSVLAIRFLDEASARP